MSVKHTPGPWEARERALDFGNINSLPCVEISAPDRKYWLAKILLDVGKPGEGAANAALMLAAPDLLAALKAILSVMEPGPDGHDERLHVWLNYPEKPEITPGSMALAAIAKAEGKP